MQRLMPACCGSNDRIWMGLPFEGFRVDVVLGEVLIDGAPEVDDAEEGAASQPALGQRCEEALEGRDYHGRPSRSHRSWCELRTSTSTTGASKEHERAGHFGVEPCRNLGRV